MTRKAGPVRRCAGDGGVSALELTFVAPGLLLFIFSAIQAGLFYYGRTVAVQAAREGVSQLRLAQTQDLCEQVQSQIDQAVERYADAVGKETLLAPKATADCVAADGKISVEVRGSVISLVPGLKLNVAQRVYGEVERFEGNTP